MGSHQVFSRFPKFPMCSSTLSPYHLTFIPYALATVVLLSTHTDGQNGRNSILEKGAFYFGVSIVSFLKK
jgi:hypothetical protein